MTPKPQKINEGNLPAAIQLLQAAINRLTGPQHAYIDNKLRTSPSLYHQLYDSTPGDQGTGNHSARSMPPVWLDATRLVGEIDGRVRKWQPNPRVVAIDFIGPLLEGWRRAPDHPATVHRLETLAQRTWRPQDTDYVTAIANKLNHWAISIDHLLDPEPVIYLMAPDTAPESPGAARCTACNTQYVYRPDPSDNNRPKRQPALKVTKDGCICQHCHASWEPGQLRILAGALGYPLPPGVLE